MPPIDLPSDEGLHPKHVHEWWYFFAQLTQPETGRRFHYTSALMRQDVLWVSYLRFWPEGESPILRQAVHTLEPQSPGQPGLVVSPRPGRWTVRLGIGRSAHHLGAIGELHFSDGTKGPCLHTPLADGGIRRYGGGLEMAWYSWPWLSVRGTLAGVDGSEGELTGVGWMEHQWGNTDFRSLSWRYLPLLVDGSDARLIAFRYEHFDHPGAAQMEVAELAGGEARIIGGAQLSPSGPQGGLVTQVSLGARGALVCTAAPEGEIDLHLPGVPRFYEGDTRVVGSLDGQAVTGIGMTELHPLG